MRLIPLTIALTLLALTTQAQAIEINFNCPETVKTNEEFTCTLSATEIEGTYDVKVELLKDTTNIARIYNEVEQKWKSAFYYLKEFLSQGEEKDKEIKLKIEEAGEFQGTLKLRKGSKKESSTFEIKVEEGSTFEEEKEETKEEPPTEENQKETLLPKEETKPLKTPTAQTILLNNPSKNSQQSEPIYESKNNKVMKYAPLAFSIFLILIISVLLWDKF